uniref:Uncharacterized protein n=1 Tax=Anguilla anguilla TaxID=7936 RepID=A0A0E9QDP3_ANGAN
MNSEVHKMYKEIPPTSSTCSKTTPNTLPMLTEHFSVGKGGKIFTD